MYRRARTTFLRNNRLRAIFVCMTLSVSIAGAQPGTSGLAFLKIGVAGRGVSMGGAATGCASGAEATYYNPAGIVSPDSTISPTQILFTHKEWIQDTRDEFLSATTSLSARDALGVSLNTSTISDIEIRTRPGPAEGSFTSRDFALGISYARQLSPDLRIGVTAKYLYEKILVDYAAGFGVDIGAQYVTPIEQLSVGVLIANLGSMSNFRSNSMQLPTMIRLGPAFSIPVESARGTVTIALDAARNLPERQNTLSIGGEYTFDQVLSARAGYEFGSETRGLGTGLGVHYGMFTLDYAYAPIGQDLGNTHTITIAMTL